MRKSHGEEVKEKFGGKISGEKLGEKFGRKDGGKVWKQSVGGGKFGEKLVRKSCLTLLIPHRKV